MAKGYDNVIEVSMSIKFEINPIMTRLDSLNDIRATALYLELTLAGEEPFMFPDVERVYEQLVEQFYREYHDIIIPEQYEVARKDYRFFLELLDLVASLLRHDEERAVRLLH
ncbi:MAG: hypothetical protein PHY31_03365 [Smithellaceae bacterium]|nr:hypothetical protein [Smithellaceae bacterium]